MLASAKRSVCLISKAALEQTNTRQAQGGIAAAIAASDDHNRHAEDTIRAGNGLCDPEAVALLAGEGPAAIGRLIELGVEFDREQNGSRSPWPAKARTHSRESCTPAATAPASTFNAH